MCYSTSAPKTNLIWTGNTGSGTDHYTHYERSYEIASTNKPTILGSSDPAFRGDKTKYNPEDLLVASVSSCHMLWYLHFCATNGVIVESYHDNAQGLMVEEASGKGRFSEIHLYPNVIVQEASMIEKAIELHHTANEYCFIANSLNFKILHSPTVTAKTNYLFI